MQFGCTPGEFIGAQLGSVLRLPRFESEQRRVRSISARAREVREREKSVQRPHPNPVSLSVACAFLRFV